LKKYEKGGFLLRALALDGNLDKFLILSSGPDLGSLYSGRKV
jgi:hypothetical protein